MTTPPERAALLLRWYPRAGRDRYGAEFTELLISDIEERPFAAALAEALAADHRVTVTVIVREPRPGLAEGKPAPGSAASSPPSPAAAGLQRAEAAAGSPPQPAPVLSSAATDPALTGESAAYTDTITARAGDQGSVSARDRDRDHGPGRVRARRLWAAGLAVVLAAGIAAVGCTVLPAKPGATATSLGASRSTPDKTPSRRTASPAPTRPVTGVILASRVPSGFSNPLGIVTDGTRL